MFKWPFWYRPDKLNEQIDDDNVFDDDRLMIYEKTEHEDITYENRNEYILVKEKIENSID